MKPHPLRTELHDEIHTRPRPPVKAPHAVSHISLLQPQRMPRPVPPALVDWCIRHAVEPPTSGQSHFEADLGALRLKWERHGEFDDYTVYAAGIDEREPFARNSGDIVLADLLQGTEGEMIAALRIAVVRAGSARIDEKSVSAMLESPNFVGAKVSDGQASLFSSFRLDDRGFGRFLLADATTTPSQLGRAVQRVVEMEVYRMMAMLAFPEARRIGGELDRVELQLSELVARLDVAPASKEPEMLHEVTRLSALTEQLYTSAAFRFGAARAYRALVRQRGEELRETRLQGVQTPTDFLERRFQPAMAYCDAVGARLASVSERIARASALLRTRVEIERERQNQALLAAMNRRAKLQLHLQQTVEGLSVAAISYYASGLSGYVFKAMARSGLPVDPELATGLAVVPIVAAAWWAMRAIRRKVVAEMPRD
ncbi:MAG: DUF3422 domain-containing protein [Burkholderiaceae bacterium]|jgi:uncharacterized membrane-anchored protein|nr:DUF3422 domain-containing protein [Burkholderiales bacterium]MCZ8340999.1 DUF3422 domain-containing protein [Burkholderiaceae bacterium]